MDLIPAYLLIIACLLSYLFGTIAPMKSVRRMALILLGIALLLARHRIVSFPYQLDTLFSASMVSALAV